MCACSICSDVLCGMVFCDISAVEDTWNPVGFNTYLVYSCYPSLCRAGSLQTFYNGPDIPDPGYVPDGAVCGKNKVVISIYE